MTFTELKEIVTRVVEQLNETNVPRAACIFGDCDDEPPPGPIYILAQPKP
jgi:hypothetical protein